MMTAKQYLSQIRHITLRIGSLTSQLECFRSVAEYSSPQWSDMPKSPNRNIHKNEDAIIRVLEWEDKIKAETDRLAEVNTTISQIENPILQSLLVKRYVENHTWETISRDLIYSLSQTKRLHFTALCEVEKLMSRNETK
jgi:hypothetical protein